MMRYHRVSPDYLPVSNGKKPNPTLRPFKEEDPDRFPNFSSSPSTFDPKSLRFRSTTTTTITTTTSTPSQEPQLPHLQPSPDAPTPPAPKSQPHHEIINGSGGDVLLQWGHNKRSRGSRAERRAAAVDESSGLTRPMVKIQRRSGALSLAVMPLPQCGSYSRGGNLRPCMPSRESSSSLLSRSLDERSSGPGEHLRSDKRCPRSPPQHKAPKMGSCGTATATATTANGCSALNSDAKPPSDQETGGIAAGNAHLLEKPNLDQFEWPRIYISLSRKEKEDDFLAMKGTKLPQRPKKRAKNVDKTLQYCFPGMWLSDLTRGRYEVREKKCVKKKRRGLKGMESMESESE
ncbi:uncharacterized protein LOC120253135 isoform X2 [Dioscorea cayenensis subsp. rotundata]|uniref:Uncharacterized protein LOC120253135 isoform X2 n=1 Tax=Dioscorea cayennensis subsp. rotundata TaxID=55577 RepID=A0AB40AQZ7_DIOCR|nr:uncharacterized protein LOC120253135 isoform X2 [Dioscorea cayenensis subsp. rotundata]